MSRIAQGWGAQQSCAYCHGFAKIPPMIRGTDGRMHVNPDYNMVKIFSVRAEPFGLSLAPGESETFAFTVPAEDDDRGDLLISEFRALFTPDTARNISVEFTSNQTDRTFQNAPIFNTLMFGDAFLNCCLPCCTLVQATNSLLVRVTNSETVPVEVRITAFGKRFLPKTEELRARMLMYWNSLPSYPYFLTLDDQEVRVDAGAVVVATMTVQGTGFFETKYPRCEVLPAAGGTPSPNDILTTITTQNGRQLQSDPLPLGAFVATPTLSVPGFPGGLYRAAAACHCPPFSQAFGPNQRIRFQFENTGAFDAIVRVTLAGCFHQVPECPPGRSMDRIRSLEPTIGPLLIQQDDYCPPAELPRDYQEAEIPQPWTPPAPIPPPPVPMAPVGPGLMFAPVAGGAGSVQPGGPLSYMQKYYHAGPSGAATPNDANARAHGYAPGAPMINRAAFSGMAGQPQAQPPGPPRVPQRGRLVRGQHYWDARYGVWRVAT